MHEAAAAAGERPAWAQRLVSDLQRAGLHPEAVALLQTSQAGQPPAPASASAVPAAAPDEGRPPPQWQQLALETGVAPCIMPPAPTPAAAAPAAAQLQRSGSFGTSPSSPTNKPPSPLGRRSASDGGDVPPAVDTTARTGAALETALPAPVPPAAGRAGDAKKLSPRTALRLRTASSSSPAPSVATSVAPRTVASPRRSRPSPAQAAVASPSFAAASAESAAVTVAPPLLARVGDRLSLLERKREAHAAHVRAQRLQLDAERKFFEAQKALLAAQARLKAAEARVPSADGGDGNAEAAAAAAAMEAAAEQAAGAELAAHEAARETAAAAAAAAAAAVADGELQGDGAATAAGQPEGGLAGSPAPSEAAAEAIRVAAMAADAAAMAERAANAAAAERAAAGARTVAAAEAPPHRAPPRHLMAGSPAPYLYSPTPSLAWGSAEDVPPLQVNDALRRSTAVSANAAASGAPPGRARAAVGARAPAPTASAPPPPPPLQQPLQLQQQQQLAASVVGDVERSRGGAADAVAQPVTKATVTDVAPALAPSTHLAPVDTHSAPKTVTITSSAAPEPETAGGAASPAELEPPVPASSKLALALAEVAELLEEHASGDAAGNSDEELQAAARVLLAAAQRRSATSADAEQLQALVARLMATQPGAAAVGDAGAQRPSAGSVSERFVALAYEANAAMMEDLYAAVVEATSGNVLAGSCVRAPTRATVQGPPAATEGESGAAAATQQACLQM